jgi:hypothetical protein
LGPIDDDVATRQEASGVDVSAECSTDANPVALVNGRFSDDSSILGQERRLHAAASTIWRIVSDDLAARESLRRQAECSSSSASDAATASHTARLNTIGVGRSRSLAELRQAAAKKKSAIEADRNNTEAVDARDHQLRLATITRELADSKDSSGAVLAAMAGDIESDSASTREAFTERERAARDSASRRIKEEAQAARELVMGESRRSLDRLAVHTSSWKEELDAVQQAMRPVIAHIKRVRSRVSTGFVDEDVWSGRFSSADYRRPSLESNPRAKTASATQYRKTDPVSGDELLRAAADARRALERVSPPILYRVPSELSGGIYLFWMIGAAVIISMLASRVLAGVDALLYIGCLVGLFVVSFPLMYLGLWAYGWGFRRSLQRSRIIWSAYRGAWVNRARQLTADDARIRDEIKSLREQSLNAITEDEAAQLRQALAPIEQLAVQWQVELEASTQRARAALDQARQDHSGRTKTLEAEAARRTATLADEYIERQRSLAERTSDLLARVDQEVESSSQAIESQSLADTDVAIAERQQALGEIKDLFDGALADLENPCESTLVAVAEAIGEFTSVRPTISAATIQADSQLVLDQVRSAIVEFAEERGPMTATQLRSQPRPSAPVCAEFRFGAIHGPNDLAALPFVISLAESHHIFIESQRPDAGSGLLQSVLLRLVLGSVPGSVRLTLIDPVGVGAGLASFLALPSALRGDKVLVGVDEIEGQLRALNRHVESVIQTRLGTKYDSLDAYNEANPAVAVPSTLVAILGLPAGGWTERQTELLMPLLRNGPRAGVHVLATIDRSAPVPRGVDLDAVIKAGLVVRIDGEGLGHVDEGELRDWAFTPDTLPEAGRVRDWLTEVGKDALTSRPLAFDDIAPPLDWSGSSAIELAAPIGLDERGEVHSFRLSDEPGPDVLPAHALVGGMVRMGKTNLLHVLIAGLSARYSPDELKLYLLDFREGVGFAPYRDLPQARVVALEAEREFALSVLRELRAEIVVRGRLFKGAGAGDKFKDYRLAGHPMARILVIIDEFQMLVTDDDPMAREAGSILKDLAKRGSGFGIHLLLSSQSPSIAGAYLNQMYSQIGLRIALRCHQPDAIAILGDGNDSAAHLDAAGVAIYNDQLGRREDNHVIRIAHLPRAEQDAHLVAVVARDAGEHGRPITFESAAPALLEANERLKAALAGTWEPEPGIAEAFLGEPLEIKDAPTSARFERAPRSNLLIAGPDETEAYGLLIASILSLAAQQPDAIFDVFDFARPSAPVAESFTALGEHLPGRIEIHNVREATDALAALSELLATRGSEDPARYLVVAGLHRWRELRSSEPLRPSPEGAALLRILDEGPEHGVHIIAWTDGYASLERTLKKNGIGFFDLRAVLRVPDTDSQNLLDSPLASRLIDSRAFYRDEQWPFGQLEKFKPYRLPEREALETLTARQHLTQSPSEQP